MIISGELTAEGKRHVRNCAVGCAGFSQSLRKSRNASARGAVAADFPLYDEEVHLFANKAITALNDLQGKRVIVGEQGSGTWLTAMNALQITGVKPAELLNLPPLQSVTAVLKGEADALFYVAGKPVTLFTKVGNLI